MAKISAFDGYRSNLNIENSRVRDFESFNINLMEIAADSGTRTGNSQPLASAEVQEQNDSFLIAQAAAPTTTSWTGKPAQRQEDLRFSFFDNTTGRTVTVTQPLWKDDNWNLGGYFTLDKNGRRVDISAWSPAAAGGQNAREVVLNLYNSGSIDPRQVTIAQTHRQTLGGDGGAHWLPTARATAQDGVALFNAQRAAGIPTGSAREIRPNDSTAFAEGYRNAEITERVVAGYAIGQTVLGIASPLGRGRAPTTIVNGRTGQRLDITSNPRTGGITGTLSDRNGIPLATQNTVGRDYNRTVHVTPNQTNVSPGGLTTRPSQPAQVSQPVSVATNQQIVLGNTPVTIRSDVTNGAPTFTAVYGANGQYVKPLPGATTPSEAIQNFRASYNAGSLPGLRPAQPNRITDITAKPYAATQSNYNALTTQAINFNNASNGNVSLAIPVVRTPGGQVSIDYFENLSPAAARSLIWNLERKDLLAPNFSSDAVFKQNGIGSGGRLENGRVNDPENNLQFREANIYFRSLTQKDIDKAVANAALTVNGKAGETVDPRYTGQLVQRAIGENRPERGNVSLVIPRVIEIPYTNARGEVVASLPVSFAEYFSNLSPSEANSALSAAAGWLDPNRDGKREYYPDSNTIRLSDLSVPRDTNPSNYWDKLLSISGLSQQGLAERNQRIANPPQPASATPVSQPQQTKPETAPQTSYDFNAATTQISSANSLNQLTDTLRALPPEAMSNRNVIDAALKKGNEIGLWFRGTGDDAASVPDKVFLSGLSSNPETRFRVNSVLFFSPRSELAESYANERVARGQIGYVYAAVPFAGETGRGPYSFSPQQFAIDLGLYTPETIPNTSASITADILRNVPEVRWTQVMNEQWDFSRITDFHYSREGLSQDWNRLVAVLGGSVYNQPEVTVFSQVFPDEIPFALELTPDGGRRLILNTDFNGSSLRTNNENPVTPGDTTATEQISNSTQSNQEQPSIPQDPIGLANYLNTLIPADLAGVIASPRADEFRIVLRHATEIAGAPYRSNTGITEEQHATLSNNLTSLRDTWSALSPRATMADIAGDRDLPRTVTPSEARTILIADGIDADIMDEFIQKSNGLISYWPNDQIRGLPADFYSPGRVPEGNPANQDLTAFDNALTGPLYPIPSGGWLVAPRLPANTQMFVHGDIHGASNLYLAMQSTAERLVSEGRQQTEGNGENIRTVIASIGDLGNKGPDTAAVAEDLLSKISRYSNDPNTDFMIFSGNHEDPQTYGRLLDVNADVGDVKVRDAMEDILKKGGYLTLESFERRVTSRGEPGFSVDLSKPPTPGDAGSIPYYRQLQQDIARIVPEDYREMALNLPLASTIGDYFLSHGGGDPKKSRFTLDPSISLTQLSPDQDFRWTRLPNVVESHEGEIFLDLREPLYPIFGHTMNVRPGETPFGFDLDVSAFRAWQMAGLYIPPNGQGQAQLVLVRQTDGAGRDVEVRVIPIETAIQEGLIDTRFDPVNLVPNREEKSDREMIKRYMDRIQP